MNIFAKTQDVLSERTKDRLISVHRWHARQNSDLINNPLGREELVRRGQDEFLQMDRAEHHNALNDEFSNQQAQLRAHRRNGL